MLHVQPASLSAQTNEEDALFAAQVALERNMRSLGRQAVREQVVKATGKGQMTRLDPVRSLMKDWLPRCAKGLSEWLALYHTKTGPKPVAWVKLADMDRATACLIALREVLDGFGIAKTGVTRLAVAIGTAIEHEQMVQLWEATAPKHFRAEQKRLTQNSATRHHRALVNVGFFRQLLAEGRFAEGWQKWTREERFHVGVALINNLVRVTHWFDLVDDPAATLDRNTNKVQRVLTPKPEALAWFAKALEREEDLRPAYAPTVIKPKRWQGTRSGGYHTPYVRQQSLITFKAANEDHQRWAADEYDAFSMPEEYASLHALQETPWRINAKVHEVARHGFLREMGLGGQPLLDPLPLPLRPAAADTDPEVAKAHRRAVAGVYNRNFEMVSARKRFTRTMQLAEQFGRYDRFYFPHKADFRGRKYPIPVSLTPQGQDLARGLLEFGEGKPVTDANASAGWLAVQVATGAGKDKVPFDSRIAWVEERNDLWRAIAADPIGMADHWTLKDDGKPGKHPYALLAAAIDWAGFLEHGNGYVSHLPVSVDGTCNGIQHLAALTRDAASGMQVNLVPGDEPRDIYQHVADALLQAVLRIAAAGGLPGDHAHYWLDLLGRSPGTWPRSLTKRQVMVLPYGGSKDAFFKYTHEWMKEEGHLPHREAPAEEWKACYARMGQLSTILWDVVQETIPDAVRTMKWLQACARVTAGIGHPLFWVTPTGFVVRHFYGKPETRLVKTSLDGQSVRLSLRSYTKDLDRKAQLLGVPPNFVHSLDAAALTRTITLAARDGVTCFTSVHDAYGTHAADMDVLARCTRQAFIEIHQEPMLARFRNACASTVIADLMKDGTVDMLDAVAMAESKLPPVPEMGSLVLEDVLDSPYFFA